MVQTDVAGNESAPSAALSVVVDTAGPLTVSADHIDVLGDGGDAQFDVGDTIGVIWDASTAGDDSGEAVAVTVDFFGIPGATAVPAVEDRAGVWRASYTLQEGDACGALTSVSVAAVDADGIGTTTEDDGVYVLEPPAESCLP